MIHDPGRRKAIIGGAWLIGFGILVATKFWWPGLMFLIAVTAVLEGWLNRNHLWYTIQAGYWSAFVGVCALVGFNLVLLLVALGAGAILGALVNPGPLSKPKPLVDPTLE